MRVRQQAESKFQAGAGLQRTFSSNRQNSGFGARMYGKIQRSLTMEKIIAVIPNRNLTSSSASSNMVSSLSNGLKSASNFSLWPSQKSNRPAPIVSVEMAEITVPKVEDWMSKCTGTTHMFDLEFSSASGVIARIKFQIVFIACSTNIPIVIGEQLTQELLPTEFSEFHADISAMKLHDKVWHDGLMLQHGGDLGGAPEGKRRFFRLIGDYLIGYHELVSFF